ncbi:DUF1753-domain-containing protein [Pseudovirgaria hyperparasitica]|uniref:DUF1753-domain-containing protein n=1 Tax=Pseudovirgaria hyperparasitica TaxID=470096 RepID=A0A6A6VXL7_9PEZI|nr:DUF1753-domain-containing protein [Pseudovirgaria hyperparasitica]KAF2754434.1 DUF1753-domain-containing protein [Pseudovirgaria hyperparasitica]
MISLPEMPRPKTFLHIMSLRSGAELITLTILINKVSGFYGLLAILTGLELSTTQLTMYLYSVGALILTIYLFPFIRTGSPLQCMALAYFYVIDSIINAAYTVAFGVAWFLVLANHPEDSAGKAPGSGTIDKTAGFTSPGPEINASEVDVVPVPKPGMQPGVDAATFAHGVTDAPAGLGNAVFQSGSIMSVSAIAFLWAIRIYFIVIMLAYARTVLRQHIATTSSTSSWGSAGTGTDSSKGTMAENPFEDHREEGLGWKGKLGRAMLRAGPKYWLGAAEDEQWTKSVSTRFNRKHNNNNLSVDTNATGERERRRRSGTGPPAPPPMPPFVNNTETR